MAPVIEDDFVLTLSDNDEIPDDELEESEVEASPKPSLKRKRADKAQSAVKKLKGEKEAGEEDEGILSDFEFDDGRAADLADFDGWDVTGNGRDTISDIVNRRKGAQKPTNGAAPTLSDAEESDVDSEDDDEEIDGDETSEPEADSDAEACQTPAMTTV